MAHSSSLSSNTAPLRPGPDTTDLISVDCELCGGTDHGSDSCSMRQTAIMDFLSDMRGPDGGWAPTSERVLQTGQLAGEAEPAPAALAAATASLTQFLAVSSDPDSLPSVPSFDRHTARPSHYDSLTASTPAGSRPESGPVPLTAEDLEALEDLTYAELAQARGIDPAEVERLSRVKLGRPAARSGPPPAPAPAPAPPHAPAPAPARAPAPAPTPSVPAYPVAPAPPASSRPPVRPAVVAPPRPAAPVQPSLPTWPPEGHVVARNEPAPHPWPRANRSGRRARRAAAVLALIALGGGAGWYLFVRPKTPSTPSSWDPRVASTVTFVSHEEGLAWKHPIQVQFLSPASYQARFGESLASAGAQAGPVGSDVAEYVPARGVVYVSGATLDYYSRLALTGQLAEALRDQYPGSASAAAVRILAGKAQSSYLSELSAAQVRALHVEQAQHA